MTNPFMSMWLTAVDRTAGRARGFWTAETHRRQTAMINEMTKQTRRFWMNAWKMPTFAKQPAVRSS